MDNLDTRCELLGQAASMPLALAPLGMAGLYARRGEVQAARAAAAVGVPFSLSTVGICSLAEVHAATVQKCWFQLYMLRDRDAVQGLLQQARRNGCDTLLFTVDLPVAGIRRRDIRNGMLDASWRGRLAKATQLAQRPGWLLDVGIRGKPHHFGNLSDRVADPSDLHAFKAWLDAQFDPRVSWDDIRWLRAQWPGRLVLKGIMEPDDALRALDCGADGIVVSNHGGRQLDGVASTIQQLPAVVEALGGRLPILLDGGIRSGVDLLRALALGAQGVLIGRPWAWALAAGGEAAVVCWPACRPNWPRRWRCAASTAWNRSTPVCWSAATELVALIGIRLLRRLVLVALQRDLADRQAQLCRQHALGHAFGHLAEVVVVAELAVGVGA
ncbi:L-lactate dehydrogenase [Stutzerimonas stutzeri TS44]|nr:L-lactate dehydrogenase [Stutzerimonas stutzeri TS44]